MLKYKKKKKKKKLDLRNEMEQEFGNFENVIQNFEIKQWL